MSQSQFWVLCGEQRRLGDDHFLWCRDFIDTTKIPAYPTGADLADEIDALLEQQ